MMGLNNTIMMYICPCMCALDDRGASPFWHACSEGQIDVMDWLICHGVPPTEMTHASNPIIMLLLTHMCVVLFIIQYIIFRSLFNICT